MKTLRGAVLLVVFGGLMLGAGRACGDPLPWANADAEAAGPKLTGPKSAPYMVELKASGVPKGTAIFWEVAVKGVMADGTQVYVESATVQTRVIKVEQAFIFSGPKGFYKVKCRLVKGEDGTDLFWEGELTAGAPPVPPTPVPPGPQPPGPVPPGPQPPDPSGPLRVIFVHETSQLLTPQQQWVMFGEKTRTYLDANAKAWRRYDKDTDATNEKDPEIKALWQASKSHVTTVPCVVVASGTRAEILPLPATEDAAVELFQKYAPKGRGK